MANELNRQNESGLASSESVLNILKLILAGAPLREVLTIIARLVEAQSDGMLCAIWFLDDEGKHFFCEAAPSLPQSYIAKVNGAAATPTATSCGAAVFRREPVYVTDIMTDPLWADYRDLAASYGLRACWSWPLISSEGKVLGSFANYYHQPRSPSAADISLIENAWNIVGIAIDRHLKENALRHGEEQLRQSQAFLAEGQRLSRTGSFSWRVTKNQLIWSEELYRIFGLPVDAPMTLDLISSRVHADDISLFRDMTARAHAAASDFEYEHRLLMPDGSVKSVHVIAHATIDREGRLEYIGAVQDVTQRRLSEEALGKARSELARVARVTSLGALTASIAHEVNQPLSGIITNASTCLRMLAADPPNIDGALKTAQRTIRDGNRASEVITRLRALFSKKETTIEPVDLNEATREVIALSLCELQRNRVILQPELADNLPPVSGDRVQLSMQVILNLLLNASDAMSEVADRPAAISD